MPIFATRSIKPRWPFVLNKGCEQANGLIGWWPFEPAGGAKLLDLSGKSNHGTLNNFGASPTSGWNASTIKGQAGRCLVTDGTDDNVNFGNIAAFNFGTNPFTVSFWVKDGTNGKTLLCKTPVTGVGNIYFANRTVSGNYYYNSVATVQDIGAKDGKWHHLAVSRKSTSSNDTNVYYDGLNSGTLTDSENKSTSNNFIFGVSDAGVDYAAASMEGLCVHNRGLSAREVWSLYDRSTAWQLRYQTGRKLWSFNVAAAAGIRGTVFRSPVIRGLQRPWE